MDDQDNDVPVGCEHVFDDLFELTAVSCMTAPIMAINW